MYLNHFVTCMFVTVLAFIFQVPEYPCNNTYVMYITYILFLYTTDTFGT